MQESGVNVQRFFVADSSSTALEAAKKLSEWSRVRLSITCRGRCG